jgi:hypothetical protein
VETLSRRKNNEAEKQQADYRFNSIISAFNTSDFTGKGFLLPIEKLNDEDGWSRNPSELSALGFDLDPHRLATGTEHLVADSAPPAPLAFRVWSEFSAVSSY